MINQERVKTKIDEIRVKSEELGEKIREIIREGTARKVTVRKGDRVLLEIPLVVGAGGTAVAVILAPFLSAIAAIAALVTHVTVVVEREDTKDYEEIEET